MTDRRSLWPDTAEVPHHPPLDEDLDVDVLVVGAGITGLTLAYLLARDGVRVAVIERDRIGAGTTGRTTAHLATSPDADVQTLVQRFDEDRARRVVAAMAEGVDGVERLAASLGIDCDFHRTDGYYWAADAEDVPYLRDELEAARGAGAPVEWVEGDATPLPFPVPAAIRWPRQARFHALQYLAGLARAVTDAGGLIFEGTRAHDLDGKDPVLVETQDGRRVRARDVVLATHTPAGVDVLHTAVAPYRSYVVTVRVRGTLPEGLFWDTAEPYHYVRPQGDLLIVGGDDHKTGSGDPEAAYASLERWTRAHFDVVERTHRWSAQVYEPVDGLPFVGRRATNAHVWVATGYSGDGTVWGTLAAHVLAQRLQGRDHPHAALVDSKRFEVRAGAGRFVKENVEVAKHFVGDRLHGHDEVAPESVGVGEARVVRRGTELLAVHRDPDGTLHVRDAVCTHMHCVVRWNPGEYTWDCPCHGARYRADGKVIAGPSLRDLPARDG